MADATASAVPARAAVPALGALAVGAAAALGIGALAAADGGYFPPSWGWTALVGLWVTAASLLLGRAELRAGVHGAVFLGGLAALTAWTWLALLWTDNSVHTVLEGLRMLAYLGAAAALLLVVRRETVPALLRGLLAAIALVATYGLATRLFPDRLGTYDPISTYRLSEPLGYWNGFGIFAAMGAVLALGLLARDRNLAVRCLAGVAFTILLTALYFTFSRGAVISLVIALLAAFALDPRRLQLAAALIVVGIPSAIAVVIGLSSDALTRQDSPLSAAADEGREVALAVVLLALVAAGAVAGLALAERRWTPPQGARRAFAVALAVLALGGLTAFLVRVGGPVDLVERVHNEFTDPPEQTADLTRHLFTFSGSYRAEFWEEAWNQYAASPVLGSGPGTYEQYWYEHRPISYVVRDAHGLYIETLAELGPLGLALLLVVLGVPLVAAVGARGHPLAAGAFGAYVAYLVHAAVDWDWELVGVTVPALAFGVALLALRPPRERPLVPGPRLRVASAATALTLASVAFVGLIGSSALAASIDAAEATPPDYEKAEDEARTARSWARWSSEPWQRLGEAQYGRGDLAAARASYRRAIEKEPDDWLLWFRLAEASAGEERRRALAEVSRLNPLSPEVDNLGDESP
jgi:O-antigen ligase/polysaccharide polymerase Wzy-like membrane protein/tetratricopeptide repeat protein